jgi:hypothetical protein
MMGLAPVFGTAANGAVSGVCVETATRDVGCRDVFDGWGPFEEIVGVFHAGHASPSPAIMWL